ncbi:hypothetical protein ACHQM5_017710 [Ranunculus cassubicifolius]
MASQQGKKQAQPEEPRVQGVAQKAEDSNPLEDIGKYRAQAQQNSMDAIRGAEERYAKAKETTLSSSHKDQPQGGAKDSH